jgi:4-diphosphocytidyl-2C-methyl-D-erythritol kinase
MLIMLSLNLTAFSQQTHLNSKGDTVVCLSVDQAKFLLKKVHEVEELKELDSLSNQQLALCDSVFDANEQVIAEQGEIIRNQKEIVELKDYQINKLNEQLEIERKAVKRQKFYKWVAIVVGSGATAFMTFKYATK